MRAKEYLQTLRRIDVSIRQMTQEIEALRDAAVNLGGCDFAEEREPRIGSDAPFVKSVHKLMELQEEVAEEIARYAEMRHTIINQIHGLKDADEVNVLYERYVNFQTFENIARRMHYSARNVHYIHGRALAEFEEKYLK